MSDSGSPRRGSFGTKSQGGNGAPRLGIYQPPTIFRIMDKRLYWYGKKKQKRGSGLLHRTSNGRFLRTINSRILRTFSGRILRTFNSRVLE